MSWDLRTSGIFDNVAEVDSQDNANSPEQSQARDTYIVEPLGADDSETTSVGVPVVVYPLLNDYGSLVPKTFRAATPQHGWAFWNAVGGGLTYAPDPGFSGIDTFTYTVKDQSGQVVRQTIRITVTPEANDDATTTPFQTPVDLDVLANDHGTLRPSTVKIITPTSNGTLAVNTQTGVVTYTPNAGFTGRDSFRYGVADQAGQPVEANGIIDVGPEPPPEPPDPGEPDLRVTKTPDRTVAGVGDLITYRLVVENRGDGPAEDVVLVDTPILRADVVSIEASQGTCVAGPPARCELGTIEAGDRVTITAVMRAGQPGLLTNGVVVTGPLPEPSDGNNADVAGVRIVDRSARVTISKRASRARVRPGGKVIFTIRVSSRGPETARRLVTCDRLPRGLQPVRAPRARSAASASAGAVPPPASGASCAIRCRRAPRWRGGRRSSTASACGASTSRRGARRRACGSSRGGASAPPRRAGRSRARPADQESNPSPSRSSARSHGPRRPSRSSARASARCVSRIPAQRAGSGGNGSGRRRTISSRVRSVSAPSSRSSADARAEAARADAEAGEADDVDRAAAERPAPQRREAAAGVDRAAPAVREAEPLELREGREEVLGEAVERGRALVALGR